MSMYLSRRRGGSAPFAAADAANALPLPHKGGPAAAAPDARAEATNARRDDKRGGCRLQHPRRPGLMGMLSCRADHHAINTLIGTWTAPVALSAPARAASRSGYSLLSQADPRTSGNHRCH